MKNWKTTVSSLVIVLGIVLKMFKIDMPQEVSDALVVVGTFAVGFFAKDSNVTGGTVQQ